MPGLLAAGCHKGTRCHINHHIFLVRLLGLGLGRLLLLLLLLGPWRLLLLHRKLLLRLSFRLGRTLQVSQQRCHVHCLLSPAACTHAPRLLAARYHKGPRSHVSHHIHIVVSCHQLLGWLLWPGLLLLRPSLLLVSLLRGLEAGLLGGGALLPVLLHGWLLPVLGHALPRWLLLPALLLLLRWRRRLPLPLLLWIAWLLPLRLLWPHCPRASAAWCTAAAAAGWRATPACHAATVTAATAEQFRKLSSQPDFLSFRVLCCRC